MVLSYLLASVHRSRTIRGRPLRAVIAAIVPTGLERISNTQHYPATPANPQPRSERR